MFASWLATMPKATSPDPQFRGPFLVPISIILFTYAITVTETCAHFTF